MINQVTLFVSSCDKNEDLWPIFFATLKKQWKDINKIKIILNTETKCYSYPGLNILCPQVCKGLTEQQIESVSWSNRCLQSLQFVDTKYCLFILDDFFPVKPVDSSRFTELICEIENTKNFGCLYFCAMRSLYPNRCIDGKKYLKQVNDFSNYKAQLIPGLWRTSLLKSLIKPGLNIWQAELEMRDRSYTLWSRRYKYFVQQEYCPDKTPLFKKEVSDNWVLCYDYRMQMVKGKWVPSLAEFLNELGFEVDYSKRGFIEHDFDKNSETVINSRNSLIEKGNAYFTFYMWLHNYIIPFLSKIKWRIIGIFKH